jgi:hypothetical protein
MRLPPRGRDQPSTGVHVVTGRKGLLLSSPDHRRVVG